jgi:hypothetical protein
VQAATTPAGNEQKMTPAGNEQMTTPAGNGNLGAA